MKEHASQERALSPGDTALPRALRRRSCKRPRRQLIYLLPIPVYHTTRRRAVSPDYSIPKTGRREKQATTMALLRSNGKLFDGNGVDLDIEMKPTTSDFPGKSGSVRSKAIELILLK